MKLVTYLYEEQLNIGIVSKDGKKIYSFAELGYDYQDMNEVVAKFHEKEQKEAAAKLEEFANEDNGIAFDKVILQAPIMKPKQDILCLGLNYFDHAEEAKKISEVLYGEKRKHAIYFSKRVNKAVRPDGKINSHRDLVNDLDYEVELAVILGKDACKIKKEDAADYVFGYTIINDVSARGLQFAHEQWYFGKSLDGFTPMGPWIITRDEVSFPPALDISCKVNGEERQHNNTKNMIFDIPFVLEEVSSAMTLDAGTIIATGTPSGVGGGMTPKCYLQKDDIVECIIESIGTLKNQVD